MINDDEIIYYQNFSERNDQNFSERIFSRIFSRIFVVPTTKILVRDLPKF